MNKSSVSFVLGSLVIGPFVFAQPKFNVVPDSMAKVVTIEVHGTVDGYATDESTYTVKRRVEWLGSGAFISKDGMVLSCAHLFLHKAEDREILVKTVSGRAYHALLLEQDVDKDLSLLKVFPLHDVKYFDLGNPVLRGQKVLAFGAPLTYTRTVSVGYVENLSVGDEKRTLHSAPINPGNSGGPLVSEDGKLVGVNVSYLLVNVFMRAEGMGQAVSLHDIKEFLKD